MRISSPCAAVGLCLLLCPVLSAQDRPISVCEALNSVRDHQVVVVRAKVEATRHEISLSAGLGGEPCEGWPRRYFTAPSLIPIFVSAPGVHPTEVQTAANLEFIRRLARVRAEHRPSDYMATIKGTLLRKTMPLIFRSPGGDYIGFGFGLDGAYAAAIVVQSILDEGYR
jgi:hypothetical protein